MVAIIIKKSGENESSYHQGKSGKISILVKVIENHHHHQILVVTEFFYIKRQT